MVRRARLILAVFSPRYPNGLHILAHHILIVVDFACRSFRKYLLQVERVVEISLSHAPYFVQNHDTFHAERLRKCTF